MLRSWIAGALSLMALHAALAQTPTQAVKPGASSAVKPVAKPSGAPAGKVAAVPTLVTSVEGVNEYALPNGLHILMLPDVSKPTTTVNMTIKVGSRMENYGETGMAHLLEHLMFKGTPQHPLVWPEFTKRGLRANGSTSFDRTNYFASMAESPENLDWYLHWLGDALVNSFIAKKDLDSEMTVVRNEMESGENNAGGVLFQQILASAYQWHNYGKTTIGARSDVENVNIEHLQAFYRQYYQPDNAVLIVTGKFDEAKTLAIIADVFGKIPRPKRALEPNYTLDPAQDGERSVTLRRVGDTPLVLAAYHIPAGSSPDYAAAQLTTLIMGGPEMRLNKAVVEKGLAAGAFGQSMSLAEPGMAFFGVSLKSDQSVDAARDAVIATVEGNATQPYTQAELERAKNIWLRGFETTFNDPERVGVSLSEYIALGDWRLAYQRRDRIKAATLDDVNNFAKRYLVTSNRTLGVFVPTKDPVRAPAPERVDVAAVLKDFKGAAAIVAGEEFDPSPANLGKRAEFGKFDSGMRYVLLPKRTRGEKVVLQIALRFGDEKSLFDRNTAGSVVDDMLSRGTERLTREQIAAEFEKLQTSWSINGSSEGLSFNIETTRANLAPSLKLVAEILRKPRFDPVEFEQLRAVWISGLEGQRSDPQALLTERLSQYSNVYPKGDVRYVRSIEDQLQGARAIRVDEVKAFYRDFYGISNAVLSVVGDFDAASVKTDVNALLGDWKSPRPYTRVPVPFHALAGTQIKIEVKDKANAILLGGLDVPLREEDRNYQALRLATQIFGGGTSGRLWDRIREKSGLSYGVGATLQGGQFNANGNWSAYAIYAPQNLDKVQTAFNEELARALQDGFTEDELKRAKESINASIRLSRAQDRVLLGTLASLVERDKSVQYLDDLQTMRDSIPLAEVNAAFRTYIVPEKLILGVAGDFAGKPAAKP